MGDLARLGNFFAASSGNVSLQARRFGRGRQETGATVDENDRKGVGRVGDGREELVERQVGVRIHPADRFLPLDEENGVRDAVGKGGDTGAELRTRFFRRLERGGCVGDANVNAADFGGAGTLENRGRSRVKLAVVFAVPRLVEADLAVKFPLFDIRQEENAPAVERFAVGVDRIPGRERALMRVGEVVRREGELFQMLERLLASKRLAGFLNLRENERNEVAFERRSGAVDRRGGNGFREGARRVFRREIRLENESQTVGVEFERRGVEAVVQAVVERRRKLGKAFFDARREVGKAAEEARDRLRRFGVDSTDAKLRRRGRTV